MSEYVGLPLLAKTGDVRAWTLVDLADAEWLSQWTWRLASGGYAVRGQSIDGQPTAILLHRVILGLEAGDRQVADHINNDRLDNRRTNLRVLPSSAENQHNQKLRADSRSGLRGVCWHLSRRRWWAYCQVNGRRHSLGYFETKEEAGRAAAEGRARLLPYSREALAA